ncbi:MAG TPA: PKD domain-containing protein [Flavitalea sp.]|nr:PKD domain-containing protein [Flavitalea sp.]
MISHLRIPGCFSELAFARLLLFVLAFPTAGCTKEYEQYETGLKSPVANAGADKSIEFPAYSTLLDGNASYDPDGKVTGWLWTQIDGPSAGNIVSLSSSSTLVTNLMDGIYTMVLKVTDNYGLSSNDTVQIAVNTSNSIYTFHNLPWSNTSTCSFLIQNLNDKIPQGKNFDVYVQSSMNGNLSKWISVPAGSGPYMSYIYDNVTGDLHISTLGTDCNFDVNEYSFKIVVH